MLAQALEGVTVLVSSSRHLAGRLAERRYRSSVHLLDDGFQHLQLRRDVDLLVARAADLTEALPMPAGRLREPVDAVRDADALIVFDESQESVRELADRFGIERGFSAVRVLEDARLFEPIGRQVPVNPAARVLVVAGVAVPERFFDDVRGLGWTISGRLTFRDHHPYAAADVEKIMESARQVRADLVLTTAKDAVRLAPYRPFPIAVACLPLSVGIEPHAEFREWLTARLTTARQTDHERGVPEPFTTD